MSARLRSTLTTISTGNEELDTRLGGGIPHPSFILIEGDNGSGKTTLSLQFVLGALLSGMNVVYISTESTARHLLSQSRNITIDLMKYYVRGQLVVYTMYTPGTEWSRGWVRASFSRLLSGITEMSSRFNLVVVDSLTPLLRHLEYDDVSRLVYTARLLVSTGTTVIATLHQGVVEEVLAKHLRAASDVYYQLDFASIGGRQVKILKVVKVRGVPGLAETTIAFDVDPAFGIKIVPIAAAQA